MGRGIGQNETAAAVELWEQVQQQATTHQDSPPPFLSDGWGGQREALLEVYGHLPAYTGRGRPPTRKQPSDEWHYAHMVKQRDAHAHLLGVDSRIIYGDEATLDLTGERTAYIERTHLTARHMNARLTPKPLDMLRASSSWEDTVYNLTRPVKTLPREVNAGQRRWLAQSPAMKAGLSDHLWSIHELLTHVPYPPPTYHTTQNSFQVYNV
ncbi:MAG: transposase [Aggregatilineales bacterium]